MLDNLDSDRDGRPSPAGAAGAAGELAVVARRGRCPSRIANSTAAPARNLGRLRSAHRTTDSSASARLDWRAENWALTTDWTIMRPHRQHEGPEVYVSGPSLCLSPVGQIVPCRLPTPRLLRSQIGRLNIKENRSKVEHTFRDSGRASPEDLHVQRLPLRAHLSLRGCPSGCPLRRCAKV